MDHHIFFLDWRSEQIKLESQTKMWTRNVFCGLALRSLFIDFQCPSQVLIYTSRIVVVIMIRISVLTWICIYSRMFIGVSTQKFNLRYQSSFLNFAWQNAIQRYLLLVEGLVKTLPIILSSFWKDNTLVCIKVSMSMAKIYGIYKHYSHQTQINTHNHKPYIETPSLHDSGLEHVTVIVISRMIYQS